MENQATLLKQSQGQGVLGVVRRCSIPLSVHFRDNGLITRFPGVVVLSLESPPKPTSMRLFLFNPVTVLLLFILQTLYDTRSNCPQNEGALFNHSVALGKVFTLATSTGVIRVFKK